MSGINLREIIEAQVWKGESYFHESDFPISKNKINKIIYPTVKRACTIIQIASPLMNQIQEKSLPHRGLEIGTGHGGLILPLAKVFSDFEWSGIEHPGREYIQDKLYRELFQQSGCNVKLCDLTRQPLPFDNGYFSLISFSEVLEHLPIEKVMFVIEEMHRVLCVGGWIITTSPNLVSLNNRVKILLGKSVFEPPLPLSQKGETFGHVRLYTVEEFIALCKLLNLHARKVQYKSTFYDWRYDLRSSHFLKNIIYKISWIIEILYRPITNKIADTWYVVLQKV